MASEQNYCTPHDLRVTLVDWLEINFDAAATSENALVSRHFTETDDALTKDWPHEHRDRIFANPPYHNKRGGIMSWVKKACEARDRGAGLVCMLLPASTDTAWFRKLTGRIDSVFIFAGRVKFELPLGTPCESPRHAPMLVIMCSGSEWHRLIQHQAAHDLIRIETSYSLDKLV